MKSVLVTGATGFIGRRLVPELLARGYGVTVAARGTTAFPAEMRSMRITDVNGQTDWAEALRNCDVVIHLAARVHMMRDTSANPLDEFRRVNVAGTLNLARQAEHAGVRRFIFISSIKVNGEESPPGRGFTENDTPAPNDPYGISKAEAEQGLLALARSARLEVVIIRPPLVYGPGVKANFLKMAQFLARGVPLPLGSLDRNRRTLVAVDNLVDLIITCIEHPAAANQVFLAGDDVALSTVDLLNRTAAALGIRARLVSLPLSLLENTARLLGRRAVMQRLGGDLQVDITKARNLLGWTPPVSVDEGLRRAVRPTHTS